MYINASHIYELSRVLKLKNILKGGSGSDQLKWLSSSDSTSQEAFADAAASVAPKSKVVR